MNSNFKLLLGGAIGAGVGWFVGSVIVDIIQLKENPYEEEDYSETGEYGLRDGTDEVEVFDRKKAMPKNGTKNYNQAFQQNPELKKLVEKYNGGVSDEQIEIEVDDNEEEDFEDLEEEDELGDVDSPVITIISMNEFASAEGFETLTFNYYDDDVVTDENDVPIDHPERILGEEALSSFGTMSGDPDVVYVRNMEKKAMYEVVRTTKEYAAHIDRRNRKRAVANRLKEDHDGEETNKG